MSQAAVHSNGKSASSQRVAVLHRQGERWRLLVAERKGTLAVLEARTLSGDPWTALVEAAERHGFKRVVGVAPGRATVARSASVPAGPGEALGEAVALMGEAQLPESLPAHRRAAGLIPDIERPGLRTALMTGWAIDVKTAAPSTPIGLEVTWTTPIAALAALRSEGGSALYADPGEGAVAMLAGGIEKTFARVLVEDTAAGFWRSVAQVAGETSAAAGAPVLQVPVGAVGPVLRLDTRSAGALHTAVHEVPDRAEWLNDYGIALGAALLATSPDPLLRPLAGMLEAAPVVQEPIATRALKWVAKPRNAVVVIAASVALMFLGPLALGAARLAIMNAKAGGVADRMKGRDESARRSAMIQQLEANRWPMSKLMADISAAVPVGVVVETLRISTDQGVTISGTAEGHGSGDDSRTAPELVNLLQSNLNDAKLFSNVRLSRIDSTGSSSDFEVTADVANPYATAKPAEDFASKPLAERLYGPGASNTTAPSGGKRRADSGGGVRESRRNRDRADRSEQRVDSGGDGPKAERPRESAGTKPVPVNLADAPKALTDDQIKAFEEAEARKEMVSRRIFSQKAGVDAATKTRLEDEVNRIKARLDQLRSAGGGKTT
jgi:hypothetical protein